MSLSSPSPDPEQVVLGQLADELRDCVERRAALDRRIDELRHLITQLERHHGIDPGSPDSVLTTVTTTRVGAVEAVLRAADGPVSVTRVAEELAGRGLQESRKNVASTLSYLGTQDRAHRVGRGRWAAGPEPDAVDGPPAG